MNVTCQLKLTGPHKAVYAARSSLADENLDWAMRSEVHQFERQWMGEWVAIVRRIHILFASHAQIV